MPLPRWPGSAGGVFYLMVLRPAIRRSQGLPPETGAAIRDEFRTLVTTAIAVLLLTGVILVGSAAHECSSNSSVRSGAWRKDRPGSVHVLRRSDSPTGRLRRAAGLGREPAATGDQQSKQSDGTSGHWHRCHRVVGCAGCTHRGSTGVLTIPTSRERVRT